MYKPLSQSFAFIIIITALAASLSLSYTNAWGASNDPTLGMRVTAGASHGRMKRMIRMYLLQSVFVVRETLVELESENRFLHSVLGHL